MHLPRSRRALLGLGALVALVIIATATFAVVNAAPEPTPIPSPSPTPSPTPRRRRRPRPRHRRRRQPRRPPPCPRPAVRWTARPLADRSLAERVPIIVQIENNPIARPPSGLNLADLVIEAPVEGDTTRFMAVFMCCRPDRGIGRSGAIGALLQHRPLPAAAWRDLPLRWWRQGPRSAQRRTASRASTG